MTSPITPPPELVEEWFMEQRGLSEASRQHITTAAARWGADQELEACLVWITKQDWTWTKAQLLAARRPKPPSLKESALNAPEHILRHSQTNHGANTIRRALEQLND